MTKLLIASSNSGKLVEMQAVLESRYPAGTFELLRPADLGLDLDVPEEGETYAENAIFKPLGMNSTSYLPDKPVLREKLARSYTQGFLMPDEFIVSRLQLFHQIMRGGGGHLKRGDHGLAVEAGGDIGHGGPPFQAG